MLRAQGHAVQTPDLMEASPSPDLAAYANHVAKAVDASDGAIVLVAHSMGGLVASQVAEWRHDRVQAIVYLTGLLIRSGESLSSFLSAQAHPEVEDLVLKNMVVSADGATATFPAAVAGEVFYNACATADAEWAASKLRPQPTAVYGSPLAVTADRFGEIPRFYVECRSDKAVPVAMQRVMTTNTPCRRIFSLEADHSPFLSDPVGTAACIEEALTALG